VLSTPLRYAAHHPRRTIRIGIMTHAILGMNKARGATQHAGAAVEPVRRAALDRRVHRESQRAARHATRGLRRAQQIGTASALQDRRVRRQLQLAQKHATRAARFTVAPPRHRARRVVVIVGGLGIGAAGLLAARRASTGRPLTASAPIGSASQALGDAKAAGESAFENAEETAQAGLDEDDPPLGI
jgi:hypothetical protein